MSFLSILVLIICSCQMPSEELPSDPSNIVQDALSRTFWAYNYRAGEYYLISSDLLVDGRYCKIWVEQKARVSPATAIYVAKIFDNEIYPKMMETFGVYGDITVNGEIIAQNTMELADWLGDGDGKLAILLLDIQDNYLQGVNQSRTAGYFSSSDLLAYRAHSNRSDMLYIDTDPEWPGSEESNKTIAHEMQHLMNFVSSYLFRRGNNVNEMDTWINEGLSAIAEWVYSEQHSDDRWVYYNADPSGLIKNGNNFFVWGNRTDEHQYAGLDDYATVYLFFHWLRLQSGSNSIFTELIRSKDYSYGAVTTAANNVMEGAGYDDWETLLKTWLAANYINATSGPYGYKNDSFLKRIKAKTVPEGTLSVQLYPGEAVYSMTRVGFPWPAKGKNIKYFGLINHSPWVDDKKTYSGGALLTFNTSTDVYGNLEDGKTSGIASNIDTTLYEQRIRALLSMRTVIDSGSALQRHDEPDPAMTRPAIGIIKLE